MPQDVPSAFFSYSREDTEFAFKLAKDLKAAGANVWLDQLDIKPGEWWDRAVEDAVTHCPRMLIVLSPASVNSKNVMDEVSFALEENKTIIPILHRDCQIPFRLRRVQRVDFRTDYAEALKQLLEALAEKPIPTSAFLDKAVIQEAVAKAASAEAGSPTPAEQAPSKQVGTGGPLRFEDLEMTSLAGPPSVPKEESAQAAAEQAHKEQAERERKAAEEKARREELERQRIAAEQARLEEERRQADAEKARLLRLEQERKAALEKAQQDEERKRVAAEKAHQEHEERERQAAAEQARLAEERQRAAAERSRLEKVQTGRDDVTDGGHILGIEREEVTGVSEYSPREVRFWPAACSSLFGWAFSMYVLILGETWWSRTTRFYSLMGMTFVVGLCFFMGTAVTALTARLAGLWLDWRESLRYACGWAGTVSLLMLVMTFFLPFVLWAVVVVAILGVVAGVLLLRTGLISPLFETSSRTKRLVPLVIALFWSSAFLVAGLYASLAFSHLWFFQLRGPQIFGYYFHFSFGFHVSSLVLILFGTIAGGGPCVAALWHLQNRISSSRSH